MSKVKNKQDNLKQWNRKGGGGKKEIISQKERNDRREEEEGCWGKKSKSVC